MEVNVAVEFNVAIETSGSRNCSNETLLCAWNISGRTTRYIVSYAGIKMDRIAHSSDTFDISIRASIKSSCFQRCKTACNSSVTCTYPIGLAHGTAFSLVSEISSLQL